MTEIKFKWTVTQLAVKITTLEEFVLKTTTDRMEYKKRCKEKMDDMIDSLTEEEKKALRDYGLIS